MLSPISWCKIQIIVSHVLCRHLISLVSHDLRLTKQPVALLSTPFFSVKLFFTKSVIVRYEVLKRELNRQSGVSNRRSLSQMIWLFSGLIGFFPLTQKDKTSCLSSLLNNLAGSHKSEKKAQDIELGYTKEMLAEHTPLRIREFGRL